MTALIQFGNYRFDTAGTPQYSERSQYESDGNGAPRIKTTIYSVVQNFTENSFADGEARIAALRAALIAGEGRLLIQDENGTTIVDAAVKVRSHSLPPGWRQFLAEVTVEFEGREEITATSQAATLVPQGGVAIALSGIKSWKESFKTDRPLTTVANRRETIVSISGSGSILAPANLPPADRVNFLRERVAEFRRADSKEAVLTIGNEARTVKVESCDGDVADGTDRLEWSIACTYTLFPNGVYAEADFEVTGREDLEAGKRYTTVQGEIRADSEAAALSKLSSLQVFYGAARTLTERKVTDRVLDGADGERSWAQLTFTLEFHEALDDKLNWELRVATREDVRNADKIISYEGKVTGGTLVTALARARELGREKLPFMQASTETISSKKTGDAAEELTEVTFSYEYMAKSGEWRFAEVTRVVQKDPLAEGRETISGYVAAGDEATCSAMAEGFKLTGRLLRSERNSAQSRMTFHAGAETRQLARYDFNFEYYLNFTSVNATYGREEVVDLPGAERTVTFNGTAFGPDLGSCNAFIDGIVSESVTGMKLTRRSRVEGKDKLAGGSFLKSVNFQYTYVGKILPSEGVDILDAEYTFEGVGSVNRAVITPIPFGVPHVQTGVGYTVGQKTVSGRCSAVQEATARNWCTAKRGLISGGHEDPPQHRTTYVFVPMSGTDMKLHRFEFTYSARFPVLNL